MKKIKLYWGLLGLLFLIACNVDTNPLKGTYHGVMIYSDTAYSGAEDTALATVEIWDSKNQNKINLACSFDSIYFVMMNININSDEPSYVHLGGPDLNSFIGIDGFILNNDSLNYSARLYAPFNLYTRFAGAK